MSEGWAYTLAFYVFLGFLLIVTAIENHNEEIREYERKYLEKLKESSDCPSPLFCS